MARSAGGPRVRYIAFRIHDAAPVERQALIETLRRQGRALLGPDYESAQPWLTRFDGVHGIVRCTHTGVEPVRRLLTSIDQLPTRAGPQPVTIETLGTSGTIRALTAKHLPQLSDAAGRGRGEDG